MESITRMDENLVEELTIKQYSRQKRKLLIALLIFSACDGSVMAFLSDGSSWDFLHTIVSGTVFLVMALAWCLYDAREQNYRMSRLMRYALVILFFVAFPVYIFRTRGFVPGIKLLILSILFGGALGLVAGLFCGLFLWLTGIETVDEFAWQTSYIG